MRLLDRLRKQFIPRVARGSSPQRLPAWRNQHHAWAVNGLALSPNRLPAWRNQQRAWAVNGLALPLPQTRYIRSSREIKRLDSLALSPIFGHFGETLAVSATLHPQQM